MVITKPDFDVAIIGGGPAGSSMGAYLARAGVSCVVFERELFPRPHVGESLVPSSTRVFKDLDFLPQMEEAKFPHKFGAIWTADDKQKVPYQVGWEGLAPDCHADIGAAIRFDEREQPGVDKNYTYHVDRGKFDLMLLQHANKLGAAVYEGVRVNAVDFGPKEPVVRFTMTVREWADRQGDEHQCPNGRGRQRPQHVPGKPTQPQGTGSGVRPVRHPLLVRSLRSPGVLQKGQSAGQPAGHSAGRPAGLYRDPFSAHFQYLDLADSDYRDRNQPGRGHAEKELCEIEK